MSKYENAMKLLEELCGNGKDNLIALATIARNASLSDELRPSVRMVNSYYEDGAFYVSTDARKSKTLEIKENPAVAICSMDGFNFHGIAENLGWVKDEKNAAVLAKFRQVFAWFAEEGMEEDQNSIVLRIQLTDGILYDEHRKYGDRVYQIDFVNHTAK